MIYFFTGLWKTVPALWGESAAWLDGTAIHYVLHMEQSIRTAAVWTRDMPLWFIRCLSWGTLAIELAALPMFLLPWFQPALRRVALGALVLLHAGIAVTLDAGLFSYVMVASYAVLLTAADWALVRYCLAGFSRPATVYYDDGCGICTRSCEVLAACDRFGRLSFIGSSDRQAYRHAVPEGLVEKTVVVFDDRSGRMYTRSRAMAAALRGLPLPYHLLAWFGLPGLRYVSDLAYDAFARNRHHVSRWLGLTACRVRDQSPPTREDRRGDSAGAAERRRPPWEPGHTGVHRGLGPWPPASSWQACSGRTCWRTSSAWRSAGASSGISWSVFPIRMPSRARRPVELPGLVGSRERVVQPGDELRWRDSALEHVRPRSAETRPLVGGRRQAAKRAARRSDDPRRFPLRRAHGRA